MVIWQLILRCFQKIWQTIRIGSISRVINFGMNLILNSCLHRELSTKAQFVICRPKPCCLRMFRAAAPEWLKRWQILYVLVMTIELRAYKAMSSMVRFGLATRSWMTLDENIKEMERQRSEIVNKAPKQANPATCMHPEYKRYGNDKGSFSRCKRCQQVFKWDPSQKGWRPHGSPQSQVSSHLPLPSSSNILEPTNRGTSSSTSRTTTSKSRAKPKARPQEVFLPAMEEIWNPEAYPPDSDGGEDGYHGWDEAMEIQDYA
jgi:hypothetical protein